MKIIVWPLIDGELLREKSIKHRIDNISFEKLSLSILMAIDYLLSR